MALFQDFPVGDWEGCATQFWRGKSTSILILKCFPTSFTVFNSNLLQRRSQAHYPGNGKIAQNMHESKAPPMGLSHVTKSQLMPYPPSSTAPEGGGGA